MWSQGFLRTGSEYKIIKIKYKNQNKKLKMSLATVTTRSLI